MPQSSQFIGVNSVTNIELDKGFMPAPIIRNADWFEKFCCARIAVRDCQLDAVCLRIQLSAPCGIKS